jgi:methylamine utilization protein MauE
MSEVVLAYTALACRCAIGLAFAVSGISKVAGRRAFAEFVASVGTLARVPPRWRAPLAAAVVALELAVPVALLTPAAAGGLVLAAGLLVAFSAAVWSALRRRTGARCRCFGPTSAPLGPAHLVRNGLLLVVAAVGAALLLAGPPGPTDAGGLVVAAAAGVVLAAVLIRFDDLLSVFTPL